MLGSLILDMLRSQMLLEVHPVLGNVGADATLVNLDLADTTFVFDWNGVHIILQVLLL